MTTMPPAVREFADESLHKEVQDAVDSHANSGSRCADPGTFCTFFKTWRRLMLADKPYLDGAEFERLVKERIK